MSSGSAGPWDISRETDAAAISQAKAAEAESAATRLMLAVAVTRSYIQLDRQYHLLDVAQRTLAQRQKILELTRQRYAATVTPGYDDMGKDAARSTPGEGMGAYVGVSYNFR